METLQLKVPSFRDNVRIVESFIDNARERFELNDDIYGNIMVAVTKSVNNAILHGNSEDSKKNVHLELQVYERHLTFSVQDEGPGFDPQSLPDPTAPENLLNPGGRGIFLIKHLADEVQFKDEGRCIVMTFYVR